MPVWLFVLLVGCGGIGTGYLFARYFLKQANLKPSHKGLLVGGFSGVGVFLLYIVLKQFRIDLFLGTPNLIFQSVLAIMFLSVSAHMMLVRLRSGPKLADLGPSPLRSMFIVLGPLTIVLSTVGLFTRSFSTAQAIVGLAQGIWLLTFGLIRTQIRGRGICYGEGLLPWRRIKRYEWRDISTLTLDLNQPRWWQDRVQLHVPPVLVDQVDQLMRRHVLVKA
jgi:hypothetical protein